MIVVTDQRCNLALCDAFFFISFHRQISLQYLHKQSQTPKYLKKGAIDYLIY